MNKSLPSARAPFSQQNDLFERERTAAQEESLCAEPAGMATTLSYSSAQNNVSTSNTALVYNSDHANPPSAISTAQADRSATPRRPSSRDDSDGCATSQKAPAPRAPTASAVETPSQLRQDIHEPLPPPEGADSSAIDGDAKQSPGASEQEPKTLDIANHQQSELVLMLASLLGKIAASNDTRHTGPNALMPPRSGTPLLAFHARNVPSISIQAYLARILKYCPMSSDIFLSLIVYFDRMANLRSEISLGKDDDPATAADPHPANRAFTSTRQIMGAEGAAAHPFSVDSFNVHRLVITGIVVASKFCSDIFYTNSRYAKVGGLPLAELNHLEFQFLLMNDFRLMITLEELQRYGDQLLHFWLKEKAQQAVVPTPLADRPA